MKKLRLLAAHGTLRIGCGNWRYFLKDASTIIEEQDVIRGYVMRSLGGCPAVYYTGEASDSIVVDVFADVTSIDAIDSMELGAGYDKEMATTDKGHEVLLYTYRREAVENRPRIENGDWCQYLQNRYPSHGDLFHRGGL